MGEGWCWWVEGMYPGTSNLNFFLLFYSQVMDSVGQHLYIFMAADWRLSTNIFVCFISYFMYWVCSFRVSIENVDSRRLSLQMFSTANYGWLQGTGSIIVTTCFPLKWRKKSLLWSLWTVQDTGKYIANPVYQRWCWFRKKKNPVSFACLIVKMAIFRCLDVACCQEWCNYKSCCICALFTWNTEKCHFSIITVTVF